MELLGFNMEKYQGMTANPGAADVMTPMGILS